jgi:enhancing lycopene biosynthesis protein 2
VLIESARIARGNIKPLTSLDMRSFDAVIFPGGFGVAKNLCSFAFQGADCEVNPQVSKVIRDAVSLRKPIGALCISPVILAKLLDEVEITIGDDAVTVGAVQKMGARHVVTTHGQVVTDSKHKVFTTPCYMLDATILQIAEGADNIVKAMLKEL